MVSNKMPLIFQPRKMSWSLFNDLTNRYNCSMQFSVNCSNRTSALALSFPTIILSLLIQVQLLFTQLRRRLLAFRKLKR